MYAKLHELASQGLFIVVCPVVDQDGTPALTGYMEKLSAVDRLTLLQRTERERTAVAIGAAVNAHRLAAEHGFSVAARG